jgi:hypothetical protein
MIDPLISLAMSIHSRPGAYALLLGSGVSRAASIPTGWEITLNLIRKYACACGEDCEPDPVAWFAAKHDKSPDYSSLLEKIAKLPAERSQLLQTYFEPTEEDREAERKVPTKAHQAIAQLVKAGKVRMILTTNFDRLLEQALDAVGVHPAVIASPDQLKGAEPYVHVPCMVVKLHGDYRDTRIRNTEAELSTYPNEIDIFLDRVLDDFGLVICGWSGEYDTALRAAIDRCPNRRFTAYWTAKDGLGERGQELAKRRGAEIVRISDADTFFSDLKEKVEALAEFERPHPLSAKLAAVQTKKYLSEAKYWIPLEDLLRNETDKVIAETNKLPVQGETTIEILRGRVSQLESLTELLASVAAALAYYGDDEHLKLLRTCLVRLASFPQPMGGSSSLLGLRLYPALLTLYAIGTAAMAKNRYDMIVPLLLLDAKNDRGNTDKLIGIVSPDYACPVSNEVLGFPKRQKVGVSDHLSHVMCRWLNDYLPDKTECENAFDKFEYLLTLICADLSCPLGFGTFVWRKEDRAKEILQQELGNVPENWPPLRLGAFEGKTARLGEAIKNVDTYIMRMS